MSVRSAAASEPDTPIAAINRPRSTPPPRDFVARALVRGLARAQRLIGPAVLIVTLLAALEVTVAIDMPTAAWPLAGWWSLAFAASLLLALRPSALTAAIVLAVGLVAGTGWVATAISAFSAVTGLGAYLVEALALALIFIGAIRPSPASGILWVTLGFATGSAALAAGHLIAGIPLEFSGDRVIDALIIAGAYAIVAIGGRRRRDRVPHLPAAARASRALADSRQRERAASALVHDTVLASLTLIERSDGALDPRLRASIRRDLDALRSSRASSAGVVPSALAEGSLAARILTIVDDFRWRGLRVDVAGIEVVATFGDLSLAAEEALLRALTAALENVRRHAGTDRADVTIGITSETVTIMVVDSGRGFDPDEVDQDRLGLRQSIRGRLDAVGGVTRIWSAESGTTVLMSVPRAAAAS